MGSYRLHSTLPNVAIGPHYLITIHTFFSILHVQNCTHLFPFRRHNKKFKLYEIGRHSPTSKTDELNIGSYTIFVCALQQQRRQQPAIIIGVVELSILWHQNYDLEINAHD